MAERLAGAGETFARMAARFEALGPIRRRAALASAVWSVLVVAYAIGFFGASQARGTTFLDGAFFLVTLVLPLILVWFGAFLAEELARQREMIAAMAELVAPLVGALEATRTALERHGPASPPELRAAVEAALRSAPRAEAPAPAAPALDRIEAGQARLETQIAALRSEMAAPPAPGLAAPGLAAPGLAAAAAEAAPAEAPAARAKPRPGQRDGLREKPAKQADLPLAEEPAPEPEAPLGWDEMMRALDFPRDAADEEGFRALRRALRRRSLAQMLQAAEDMLTYLSQEGVYMDDLAMDPADPEAWRRFAAGGRGVEADAAGGVRDEGALDAARGLMKQDAVFRDTALFFLRRFDAVLGEIVPGASDAALAQLADTRSGRAFQLMARATGSFE